MSKFLTAREARQVASSTLVHVFYLISEAAHNSKLEITVQEELSDNVLRVLKDYGYNIECREFPIYRETPYGKLEDTPSGYKKETIISWHEN